MRTCSELDLGRHVNGLEAASEDLFVRKPSDVWRNVPLVFEL